MGMQYLYHIYVRYRYIVWNICVWFVRYMSHTFIWACNIYIWSIRYMSDTYDVMCASSATHCNTLQHTATHCNTLQHTATHCNVLQHTATYCNTLQRTATRCSNVLQHTMTSYVQLLQWQQQQNVRQRWRERISTNLRPLLEEVHFTFLSPVGRQMWQLLRFHFNVSFRIRRSLLCAMTHFYRSAGCCS